MALKNTDTRNRCLKTLLDTGAGRDVCEFYADAAQYEYDVTHAICRIRKELQAADEHQTDAVVICGVLQTLSTTFVGWKKTLDNLSSRQDKIPSIKVDSNKFKEKPQLEAVCCIQTKQIQLKKGDSMAVVDTNQPNKLKVRSVTGDEGYIPTVCCMLPSPDVSAKAVIDRLQIYLLMCWHECYTKAKLVLCRCLFATTADIWTHWKSRTWKRTKFDERVSRRLKRVMATTTTSEGPFDCNRLHQILSSLETELSTRKTDEFIHLADTIGELDKAVLYYETFRRHWRLFRHSIKDSTTGLRPMHLLFNWDPNIFTDPNKTYKYYEVKLTTEERTVKEETVAQTSTTPEPVEEKDAELNNFSVVTNNTKSESAGELDCSDGKDPSLTSGDERTVGHGGSSSSSTTVTTTTVETSSAKSPEESGSGGGLLSPRRRIFSGSERWTQDAGEEVITFSTAQETSKSADSLTTVVAGSEHRASFSGGSTRQSVDAEQVVMASHEETRRFFVKTVIDPRDGQHLTMEQAVAAGVIDQPKGLYINPATGASVSITTAIGEGHIKIEHVATTRTRETTKSLGLMTIRTETDTREYTIQAAIDTVAGQKLDADEAQRRGIIDEQTGSFFNTATGRRMTIDEAIDVGLIFVEFESESSPQIETKTYAVSAVVDQLLRRAVPFPEAVQRGLVQRDTGSYVNNATGEMVFAGEAIRRGFYKCQAIDDPKSLIGIDAANKVVVDRIDRVRKNVLREVQVVSAFKSSGQGR